MTHKTENQHSIFKERTHIQKEIFVQNGNENKSALKIFVREQRQTLIYTTQSAG